MDRPQEITMPNPVNYHESRHDIEVQSPSPMTGSFLLGEKGFPSSPTVDVQTAVGSVASLDSEGKPVPVRKYSREWFHSSWDNAVRRGLLPRLIYTGIGISIICIWIGITIHFASEQVLWSEIQRQAFTQILANDIKGGVGLEGALKKFDPATRQLTIEWSGIHQDYNSHKVHKLIQEKGTRSHWPLAIYRDISTKLYIRKVDGNVTDPTVPLEHWYRIDNSSAPHIATIGTHEWDSFGTDISLQQASDEASILSQPLVSYPWDEWAGQIVFVANDLHAPNVTQTRDGNITGGNVVPLVGARLVDTALNWRFNLTFENPCALKSEEVQESFTRVNVSAPYWIANNTELLDDVPVPCHLNIRITATRPPLVKFAVIMSLLVNWTSTFFIFVLTCEALLMRRGFMLSGTDILGVTFTSLFALPSVRLLLPGAPEFGCLIDLVGIIPNVIIISLCICAIAITKLNRNKKTEKFQ